MDGERDEEGEKDKSGRMTWCVLSVSQCVLVYKENVLDEKEKARLLSL
jgi:hypothetical protein